MTTRFQKKVKTALIQDEKAKEDGEMEHYSAVFATRNGNSVMLVKIFAWVGKFDYFCKSYFRVSRRVLQRYLSQKQTEKPKYNKVNKKS